MSFIKKVFSPFFIDVRAAVSIEFVLVLPFLLMMYIGSSVLFDYYNVQKRTTQVSYILGDITAQYKNISSAEVSNILSLANLIIWPHPTTGLGVRVIDLKIDNSGHVAVDWSMSMGAGFSGFAQCKVFSGLPAGLNIPGRSVILAEARVIYTPAFHGSLLQTLFGGFFPEGGKVLYYHSFSPARVSDKILLDGAPSCS